MQQAQQAAAQAQQRAPQPDSELSDEERTRLKKLIGLIRSRNPYQLSRDGVLYLPGFTGIPLAGLIEDLATLRLKVDPAFTNLDIRVTRLPLKKTGPEGLKPFGYDLFSRSPSTFAPVTNVPVPADYVVGAGDLFEVQLYGTQNRTLFLTVGRDGRVNFPELGRSTSVVSDLRKSRHRSKRACRVEIIGVRASVSMGRYPLDTCLRARRGVPARLLYDQRLGGRSPRRCLRPAESSRSVRCAILS